MQTPVFLTSCPTCVPKSQVKSSLKTARMMMNWGVSSDGACVASGNTLLQWPPNEQPHCGLCQLAAKSEWERRDPDSFLLWLRRQATYWIELCSEERVVCLCAFAKGHQHHRRRIDLLPNPSSGPSGRSACNAHQRAKHRRTPSPPSQPSPPHFSRRCLLDVETATPIAP